ncbi:MAG TPA: glycosyltransferase 87 family protein [Thermoanaerobaculia bacterium]|jgi:hypothetical protein
MKWTGVAALAIAAASLIVPWRAGRDAAGIDLFQFWAGAQLARDMPSLYAVETRVGQYAPFQQRAYERDHSERLLIAARLRGEFEFYSTPFLYTAFGVLPSRYDAALLVYRVLSLAAFAAGMLLLARAAGLGWTAAALLLAFAATLFEPLKSEMRVVNVNCVQLFVIALAVWLARDDERWKSIAAGALLALVTAFKPNLLFIVPLLLLARFAARDWARLINETLGAALGAIIAIVSSAVYFRGLHAWIEWIARARSLATALLPLREGNVAPALPLANAFGIRGTLLLTIVLVIAAAVAIIRGRGNASPVLIAGVALLIYLLSATLVWLHYLVLALPVAIALVADVPLRRGLALFALTLVGLDLYLYVFRVRFETTQAALLWTGLALLFATSLWRLSVRTVSPYAASEPADERSRRASPTRPARPKR